MSHNHEKHILCPNCGYDAQYNYCARCGQATHLHKDTFIGLILHFVEHYFHYDSKFWKTLKALWFKPGELTIAYREKQRMRYIPPISLYIFISAVFFLAFFLQVPDQAEIKKQMIVSGDSASKAAGHEHLDLKLGRLNIRNYADTTREEESKFEKMNMEQRADFFGRLSNNLMHNIPKWFFVMIPIMGLVLLLLFARRKQLYFVDHTIFSLHFHSFVFSVFLIYVVNPFDVISDWLMLIFLIASTTYFIMALRKTYAITWVRSVFYSIIIAFSYFLFLVIVFVANFALIGHNEGLF